MSTNRSPLLALGAALVLATLLLVGCSSDDASSNAGEASTTTATTASDGPAAAPVTSAPRQTCDAANLAAAAAPSLPGATLTDVVCESKHAVATWESSPNGALIVLFSLENGVWVYKTSGPVDGDVAALAVDGFSTTAVPEWQRLRASRASRANADPSAGSTGAGSATSSTVLNVNRDTGVVESCAQNGDGMICTPLPGVPPDQANVPPSSLPPSMFCKYNYNDPRCAADNQFTP